VLEEKTIFVLFQNRENNFSCFVPLFSWFVIFVFLNFHETILFTLAQMIPCQCTAGHAA